jgi:hypothetical protein
MLVVGGIALVRLDEVRGEARAEPLQTGILPMPDAAGVRRGSG